MPADNVVTFMAILSSVIFLGTTKGRAYNLFAVKAPVVRAVEVTAEVYHLSSVVVPNFL